MKFRYLLIISMIFAMISSCDKDEISVFKPEVNTTEATEITSSGAISGGNVISDGGETVTERGVCWSKNQNPGLTDDRSSDGAGIGGFVSELSDLTPETKYYYRAFATNSEGTAYGDELSFTTEVQCELICDIGTETYSINISCESGGFSTTFNNESTEYIYDDNSNLVGLKVNLNQTRTYLSSNNSYTITGLIEVDLVENSVSHDITVEGGKFSEPQTCD